MDELIQACEKFKDRSYSIDDLYRRLSWVAVPNQFREVLLKAEQDLELIQFTELEDNWYEEGMKVVRNLLEDVGYTSL
ncbi:hypothetical protein QYF50_00040 [Paenibacillus vini]|uniref:hypothetical protein n=1 Tax=Paenibacillus vini TaxID=1476024 RepID=UPI0025B6F3BB|nr:hypothetical protein [Paenibacillus vini]MDN4066263.1 hypothetical protein [Paenibacillus vini]